MLRRPPSPHPSNLQIDIHAFIESFDAMTSNRTYRPIKDRGAALKELCRQRGKQFDPYLVACFCSLIPAWPLPASA